MKIVHIAGVSGTGKTTFISSLIPAMKGYGPIGVIKHIGHHDVSLEEGKDTTLFFEAGAKISAGIDSRKTISVVRETDLENILVMFCDAGVQIAIIEGFKSRAFPKFVIGKLGYAENVLMTDPTVDDVIARLDACEEFTTAEGFAQAFRKGCSPGNTVLTCTLACPQQADRNTISDAEANLVRKINEIDSALIVRLCHSGNIPGRRSAEIHLGVCAADPNSAIKAALFANEILLPLTTPVQWED
ncbi:MAG TPA: molybdopterin-guanine dinucleotide biosynthesis protein B [Methanoregulaceae archaeon]|nr:MAG: molybdopterin-guanine dinucleotide biosynthesis protein B [Methanolinea sp.]HON81020.1 molybdopterin-guanine dinucleotide biosynthesis protein B [Methanoregulaceae archaeon]HPD10219.1 molybdopterin-guanine dinucleotide biosynthesis protein B [Methanoregulaceae archaeon]HRT14606.1 molybdopterin-guanine dinucleotide biosynthesis protein B [Methanoregulaceae archaeon]HRU30177.1 molybdopterin-guanine dinucleotide biosynthesis protein B [Methanoregulaceae archaeon]